MKLEETKPVRLAYVEHMGSYDKIPFPQYMEKLYGWAKEKHIRPGLFSIGLYYDSDRIASEKRRSEIETYTRRPRTIGGRIIGYAKVKAPVRKKQPHSMVSEE